MTAEQPESFEAWRERTAPAREPLTLRQHLRAGAVLASLGVVSAFFGSGSSAVVVISGAALIAVRGLLARRLSEKRADKLITAFALAVLIPFGIYQFVSGAVAWSFWLGLGLSTGMALHGWYVHRRAERG